MVYILCTVQQKILASWHESSDSSTLNYTWHLCHVLLENWCNDSNVCSLVAAERMKPVDAGDSFSALTLLVGWQEGHPSCKKPVPHVIERSVPKWRQETEGNRLTQVHLVNKHWTWWSFRVACVQERRLWTTSAGHKASNVGFWTLWWRSGHTRTSVVRPSWHCSALTEGRHWQAATCYHSCLSIFHISSVESVSHSI